MKESLPLKGTASPSECNPIVYVVDDDPDLRTALSQLGETIGLGVQCFECAGRFLAELDTTRPSCLVLDVRLPEMTGIELQQELNTRHVRIPIIMMSGYSEARTAVTAMKQGAITYLEKPFGLDEMLGQIQLALRLDSDQRNLNQCVDSFEAKLDTLSSREAEILEHLVDGATTQEIALRLEISPKTVDSHRWKIFEKLGVDSVVKLACRVLKHRENRARLGASFTADTRA